MEYGIYLPGQVLPDESETSLIGISVIKNVKAWTKSLNLLISINLSFLNKL
jgi:hypothetical protein